MTEEKKDTEGKENSLNMSDDDLSETSEAEYRALGSNSNHSVDNLELNLEDLVASGTEVEAGDVMIIEELPDGTYYEQNSDEVLEPLVLYEYKGELDEERTPSQLSQAYFDNFELYQEQDVSDFLVQNNEKEKKPLNKTDKKKGSKKMKEIPNEKNVSESGRKNHQVVRNPCTQIHEITPRNPINSLEALLTDNRKIELKCPDYGSDEFADVEDNANSSSENIESVSGVPATVPINSCWNTVPSKRPKQERRIEIIEEGRILSKNEASSSSPESDLVNKIGEETPADKRIHKTEKINVEASCSSLFPNSSTREELLAVPKMPEFGKKSNKCSMPTIEEVSENEDKTIDSTTSQASHSKANPLKIKAKVGIRKDKCNVCRVRLGLCAIKCRCGGYYCAKHRYDKEHNCTFDYRSMGAEEIRRNNPRIIAEKKCYRRRRITSCESI